MKNIRFTQVISLSVTVEAEIPNDWDSDVFADEWITNVTVNEPDDPADNGDGFVVTGLHLDSAEVIDTTVWTTA